jgi:deazaflavin-dependent oxidoreductase (nitroreductase family)
MLTEQDGPRAQPTEGAGDVDSASRFRGSVGPCGGGTVPVFYLRDDDRFVICNVRPPRERVNPWVLNIRANPDVALEVSGRALHARAREATEVEVAGCWPRLVSLWPAYEDFRSAGGQRSVFILESVPVEATG